MSEATARSTVTFTLAVVFCGSATLLTGCREHLDTGKLEQVMLKGLNEKLAPDRLTVATVSCPESVTQAKGNSFTCTASFQGGGKATVDVEQQDDQGNVHYRLRKDFITAAKVEASIAERLEADSGKAVAVNCGDRVQPSIPKTVFQCAARDESGEVFLFNVTITDGQGNVTWSLAGKEPPVSGAEPPSAPAP